eukprot:3715500-Amphidinium_carterae.1
MDGTWNSVGVSSDRLVASWQGQDPTKTWKNNFWVEGWWDDIYGAAGVRIAYAQLVRTTKGRILQSSSARLWKLSV